MTSSYFEEKSTLKELELGETVAFGFMFNTFEKAAKPIDNPITHIVSTIIVIICNLLPLSILTPPLFPYNI